VSRAEEILRDYLARRRSQTAPPAVQEENLRRLLQHTAAAHRPADYLESHLLETMVRAAHEQAARHQERRPWPWLRPVPGRWTALALATVALAAVVAAWQLRPSPSPRPVVELPPSGNTVPLPPAAPPHEADHKLVGYVLLPQGEMLRRSPGQADWQSVEGGDPIRLGDALRTEAGSSGSLVFLDGSDCRLASGTTLTCLGSPEPEMKRPSRIKLPRGEAWFRVEKGGPTFMVEAPAATAVVQGTFFGVAVEPKGNTTLRVAEGAVRLTTARGAILVRAGRQSTVLAGRPPQAPVQLVYPKPRPRPAPAVRTPARPGRSPGTTDTPPGHTGSPTFEMKRPERRSPEGSSEAQPDSEAKPGTPLDSSGHVPDSEPRPPVSTSPPPR
jgi:hypothetical protein